MREDTFYFGSKKYRTRRRAKQVGVNRSALFIEREPGESVVDDIIDAAACLRRAHPLHKDSPALSEVSGETRVFWALMLDAARQAAGITLDDLIERIRTRARADLKAERGSMGNE